MSAQRKAQAATEALARAGPTLVAFSGGVDSTLVAALAQEALGPSMLTVTADSETLYPGEADEARAIARARGWPHLAVRRSELADPAFAVNDANRCFHCKDDLYAVLYEVARARGLSTVADGTNASDLGEVRPGMRAARQRRVLSPLADAGLTKVEVRELARSRGLPNADKPALACLSSRFAHGQLITLDGLDRVARGEAAVRRLVGVELVRVRDRGGVARVEVVASAVPAALARAGQIAAALVSLGFREAFVDPQGYRAGGADDHQASALR